MQVKYGGRYVILEYEEDWEDMLELWCNCGHKLRDHDYHNLVGSPNHYEIGRCLQSDHCRQFNTLKGRVKSSSWSYA